MKQAFDDLRRRFRGDAVDEPTTFYFSLGDAEGQKWTMTLTPEACTVTPGKVENADCVLKTSADLFLKFVAGAYTPGVGDFMTGKIKSNDPLKLELLKKVFEL